MITIVTEIAKYLIIFFMVLYTVKCFTVLKPVPADKKRRALNVQIFYVFMIHFLCYLTLYLHYEKKSILIFYLLQMIVSITYMVSYHAIYKGSSRLITNNMSFLLLIGYVMLTRLDFDHDHVGGDGICAVVRGKVPADKEMEYILCGVWYRLPVHGVHPACGS